MLWPWTTAFIRALDRFSPSRLGVVGPTCLEGIPSILSNEFVHRTHTDVFEVFYPPELVDHLSQHWISKVYPAENSKELSRVVVRQHTYFTGRRYRDKQENIGSIDNAVATGAGKIQQYITSHCNPSPCVLSDFHATPARGARGVGAQPGPATTEPSMEVQVITASSKEMKVNYRDAAPWGQVLTGPGKQVDALNDGRIVGDSPATWRRGSIKHPGADAKASDSLPSDDEVTRI